MAMGLPCITSRQVNNAIGAKAGSELLIGDSAAEVAEHILHVMKSPEERKAMGLLGREFVKSKYTWGGANEKLESLIFKDKS